MWRNRLKIAEGFLARRKGRRAWRRVVSGLACAVVFCTTYALILPAITLEGPTCGKEAHTHEAGCYSPDDNTVLTCGKEEHTHTEACYAQTEGIPQGILEELAKLDVYPGTKLKDGLWEAYDAATVDEANVKVTIELTGDLRALPNHYPFISKVDEKDEYYPDLDAVRRAVGEFNDVQCYKIHWVKIDPNSGKCNFTTNMELGNGKNSTIKLEYLKPDAQLKGIKGGRKLRVFSSKSADGTELVEISNSVQNVQLMQQNYQGFTFQVTEPCPYVFVSEKVEEGYIEHVGIKSLVDGSGPFDSTDAPGNDSSGNNRIVRSYDTIQYNLAVTFAARQADIVKKETKMYFELILGKSATAARFSFDKMLWLGDHYGVEYLTADNDVVMVMDHKGGFYEPLKDENGNVVRDESGFVLPDSKKPVSFNAQLNGSGAKEDSYKVAAGGVVKQRLTGWTMVKVKEGENNILSATRDYSLAVEVRNADNEEVFAPYFRLWLDGNEENYGPETEKDSVMLPAQVANGNILDINADENQQYQVKVSAGTNFNLQLKRNTDMSYKNWFDFSTGQAVTEPARSELVRLANLKENHGKSNPAEFMENGVALPVAKQEEYANYRYGRITCYGITLQLYNDTDNDPSANRASKGLKGISLPVGDITFDLNFWSEAKSKNPNIRPEEYTAILWDYNENVPAHESYSRWYADPGRGTVTTPKDGKGNGGRNIFWDGEVRSPYAKGGAPSNYIAYHGGCYYGGDWAMVNGDGTPVKDLEAMKTVASPTAVTGTGAGTTYHFKVSDYDFDFDSQYFPTQDAGNTGDIPEYKTYARCFSAGCVQVLSVFPMVQEVSEAEIFLNTKVSNLSLTTRAGQKLEAKADDDSKINHEVNTGDNTKRDQIVLYAPGNLTKGSAFNGRYTSNKQVYDPTATNTGYLGTEYWSTSYDCSTFAGNEIWLMSYGMISAGSDYRTQSMNLLQLFDSRALQVRGQPDVVQHYDEPYDAPGTSTFLFAADPDYLDGYDTNQKGVLAYMNTVREEDLVYTRDMPDAQGYITVGGKQMKCVGVLMEMRGCDLLGGKYQYMRIPIRVNGDDPELVTKTVATVNAFRVWSDDLGSLTWADGKWDDAKGKNVLEGYTPPNNRYDSEGFSGELANRETGTPPHYIKTEYEDGHQVTGTHAGGTLSGNSLLILSYTAKINIQVDGKSSDSGFHTYNQANNERVVDYRLKNIIAETDDKVNPGHNEDTTLNIKVALDEDNKTGKERLLVSSGSYRIKGYKTEDGTGEPEEFPISADSDNPTVLYYRGSDGEMHQISVYAAMGAGSKSVSFVIQGAPVGIMLPDITFQANFGPVNVLENNDTLKTSVYISGQGDVRAYDKTKGNTDNVTVGVVTNGGTSLSKARDLEYIELDGSIQYTITYSNQGNTPIETIYFYDLLPSNNDIRDSRFDGDVYLVHFGVKTDDGNGTAQVYYSTKEYRKLYDTVKVFGGKWDETKGQASGMSVDAIEKMLAASDILKPLGRVENNTFKLDTALPEGDDLTALMGEITGLYVKVENLQGNQSVHLTFKIATRGNKAADTYKNIANSWIAGSPTLPLVSNKVETTVISRRISGVVWHDQNLNGIRDTGEPLLENVTATLFKKNGDKYEKCTENVKKDPVTPVTTTADGAYDFENLAEGDYIVAFSGEALEKYTGAAAYQVHGTNDANTSDGAAFAGNPPDGLTEEQIEEGGYLYYIRYSPTADQIKLHSLRDIVTIRLTNGVELYANQDLGVVLTGPELPMTGGPGSSAYTFFGLILMAGAALLHFKKNWRKEENQL